MILFKIPDFFFRIFNSQIFAGLPNGQEKSVKNLKNDKSQEKMGGFEKKSGKARKFDKIKKKSDFVSLNLQNSLFSKAFKWKKLIKSPLKSEKNSKIFLEIYKNI